MTPDTLKSVREHIASHVIGQHKLIDGMLICLLSDGHLLVEGMPGLAKTTAVNALSEAVAGDFHRIQFTPDLLPSDVTGSEIYREHNGTFEFQPGPLFHNLVLADEVNRATPKAQSALLESMEEYQVSVDGNTRSLPEPFFVVATQNPADQIGTFPLPESQLDRFLMRLSMGYPGREEELELLRSSGAEPELESLEPVLEAASVLFEGVGFGESIGFSPVKVAEGHERQRLRRNGDSDEPMTGLDIRTATSPLLLNELRRFMLKDFGFGDFIFRNAAGIG